MNNLETATILEILQSGRIEIEGLLPWSSNYAFLVRVCDADMDLPAVYKPSRGERPLWDFPQGTLSFREQAAYLISEAIGWELVPPTVLRDAEHGHGSFQLFINHDPEQHYFSIEGNPVFREVMQRMVLLDVIINNADRKGGHVILEENSQGTEITAGNNHPKVWGIDHGICFHAENKLRTVIWEFAGENIPEDQIFDIEQLSNRMDQPGELISERLQQLLSVQEIRALRMRMYKLLKRKTFPVPGSGRHYPWPPV